MEPLEPRLESVWFGSGQYPRLARVLDMTARRHCPGWAVNVRQLPPHDLRAATGSTAHAANAYKLDAWVRTVREAPDGSRIVLLDSDAFVTRSLDGLWDYPFDIAYTVRDAAVYPFNAGFLAVRVSAATRLWMDAWLAQDMAFLRDREAAEPWRRRFGGQNQASLGAILTTDVARALDLHVAKLLCREWNCEDTTWAQFDSAVTRVVHVKSALRMDAFHMGRFAHTDHLARMWRGLDEEARAVAAA